MLWVIRWASDQRRISAAWLLSDFVGSGDVPLRGFLAAHAVGPRLMEHPPRDPSFTVK